MPRRPRLGVLVNPIAGLGGSVGLKGTDTPAILAEARSRGATPKAPARMALALASLAAEPGGREVSVLTADGAMGADEARAACYAPDVIDRAAGTETGPEDTRRAARALSAAGVDLILFAGGDGTARDLEAALGTTVPALGVPCGVKMHSGVFAANPRAAAALAARYLRGGAELRALEVMDIDEAAYRRGAVSAALHGYLSTPFATDLVQGVKVGGLSGDRAALAGIAEAIAELARPEQVLVLGPGTTVRAVAERLSLGKTLLGVDLARAGRLLAADADERAILAALAEWPAALIVVSPIGGQGFIFGRGNQQMSPAVLRRVGLDNIVVVATSAKLAASHNQTLRVDTGEPALDAALSGYRRVITGYGTLAVCRVLA
jgi:predicted polyphosphate/ATP-dependent NAD kinase